MTVEAFFLVTLKPGAIAPINQTPQTQDEPKASESCAEWTRGRVELWRWSLQLWMHSVISQEPWPVWRTLLTKPAQILWSCEERFR